MQNIEILRQPVHVQLRCVLTLLAQPFVNSFLLQPDSMFDVHVLSNATRKNASIALAVNHVVWAVKKSVSEVRASCLWTPARVQDGVIVGVLVKHMKYRSNAQYVVDCLQGNSVMRFAIDVESGSCLAISPPSSRGTVEVFFASFNKTCRNLTFFGVLRIAELRAAVNNSFDSDLLRRANSLSLTSLQTKFCQGVCSCRRKFMSSFREMDFNSFGRAITMMLGIYGSTGESEIAVHFSQRRMSAAKMRLQLAILQLSHGPSISALRKWAIHSRIIRFTQTSSSMRHNLLYFNQPLYPDDHNADSSKPTIFSHASRVEPLAQHESLPQCRSTLDSDFLYLSCSPMDSTSQDPLIPYTPDINKHHSLYHKGISTRPSIPQPFEPAPSPSQHSYPAVMLSQQPSEQRHRKQGLRKDSNNGKDLPAAYSSAQGQVSGPSLLSDASSCGDTSKNSPIDYVTVLPVVRSQRLQGTRRIEKNPLAPPPRASTYVSERDKRLIERKQRNRRSAARSNARRRLARLDLQRNLKEVIHKKNMLQNRERALLIENAELKIRAKGIGR